MEMVKKSEIDNIYVVWHQQQYKDKMEKALEGVSPKVTYININIDANDPNFSRYLENNGYKPIENWKRPKGSRPNPVGIFQERDIKNGEMACGIGHLTAWKQAKKDNAQRALFIEQDVEIRKSHKRDNLKDYMPDANDYISSMDNNNEDWDILYLGFGGNVTHINDIWKLIDEEGNPSKPWPEGELPYKRMHWCYCTHAYILSSSGIDILLDNDYEHQMCAPDEYMPALFAKPNEENIHPSLKYLHGRMKAYVVRPDTEKHNGSWKIVGDIIQGDWQVDDDWNYIYEGHEIEGPEWKSPCELIVIDNFIKDEDLLREIDESEDFWKYGYFWWDGWEKEPATTLRHRLIEHIYRYNPWLRMNINTSVAGYEHWVGRTTPDNVDEQHTFGQKWALRPHQDKDELFWEQHPKGKDRGDDLESMKYPLLGTVFYTQAPEEGGYLQIWNTSDFNKLKDDEKLREAYQLIKPKRNRLIVFDAGKVHGVRAVTKGTRKAIAINLWNPKPITKMEKE